MSQPTRYVFFCAEFGGIGPVAENPWIFGATGPIPPNGRRVTAIYLIFAALFFLFYHWVNIRLVTRHLFAVSGYSPSQKIEFGSKPAGL